MFALPPAAGKRTSSMSSTASSKSRRQSISPSKLCRIPLPIPTRSKKTGLVYIFGNGDGGQLGLGEDIKDALRPRPIRMLDDIVDIAVGGMHSLAISEDGVIYSWGNNDEGALGRSVPDGCECDVDAIPGSQALDIVRMAAGDSISLAISSRGELYAWGTFRGEQSSNLGFSPTIRCQLSPTRILEEHVFVDIAAGDNHALALTSTGIVYAWGNSEQRQAGFRTTRWPEAGLIPRPLRFGTRRPLRRIVSIACGSFHSLAIDDEGKVWCFGLNNFGQCGCTSPDEITTPVMIDITAITSGKTHFINNTDVRNLSLCDDGSDNTVFNDNETSSPRNVPPVKAVAAAAGEHHSVVLLEDGRAVMFGKTDGGELGLGFVRLGPSGELTNDLEYYDIAGPGGVGFVKKAVSKTCIPKPHENNFLSNLCQVSCGTHHNIAVDANGDAFYWGSNIQGQLGNNTTDDAMVPRKFDFSKSGAKVLRSGCGAQHSVLLVRKPS